MNHKPRYILGISCYYHDAAACLLKNGQLVAASEEERFTRKKHDPSFPINAIRFCLQQEHITTADLAAIGFYEKPLLKFERMIEMGLMTWPRGYRMFMKSIPQWTRDKLWVKDHIRKSLKYDGDIFFSEHHLSHAASSFFPSPFDEAAILTMDGVGEWETATFGIGHGNDIYIEKHIDFPHSLGLLYSIITHFLGFRPNSAEYKVMGLAPYGTPRYANAFHKLIDIKDDGSFALHMKFFEHTWNLDFYNPKIFEKLFGFPKRNADDPLEQHHKDLAMSLQKITEEIILKNALELHRKTGLTNLCLAGGVALNCVANGRIKRETPFKNIFIQPAAGDAGGAIGIALLIWTKILGNERTFRWPHCYWGPEYSDEEIRYFLDSLSAPYKKLNRTELITIVAKLIADNQVVGWFQGRAEWGPRALGNRSILADARNAENRDRVNLKIKFRESFRPFAPSVIEERAKDFFELDPPAPYMLVTAPVRKDKRIIPAVTHIDGSARVQTISHEQNPLYYDLLRVFGQKTGCPVVINTSFNIRGEPIVNTLEDAWKCFINTKMDYLAIGSFLLDKRAMKLFYSDENWKDQFELD